MPKVHSDSDVTVTITFPGLKSNGARYMTDGSGVAIEKVKLRHYEDFERLVKRHVEPHADGMYHVHGANVIRSYSCSHCGRPWTEESDTYNGGCCASDEEGCGSPSAVTDAGGF